MKHAFYFRFYKMIHNEFICCFLAQLAYFLYCCLYFFKKLRLHKKNVNMTFEQAHNLIDSVYQKPDKKIEYINSPIDDKLDLSVVIPVYNYAEILEQNIKSILNQKTDFKYEVIFVDDGSTDGAKEILKKYENEPKVKVIYQQNGGIGTARNAGINAACGKYLMFIDCDDTVHSDIIQTLMERAVKDNCDIVMAAHNLDKEKNGTVYEVIPNVYPQKNLMRYKYGNEIMNYAGLPWAKVYKRELWNKVRFFPGYWYEDTIIQMLIYPQCKTFEYIPKIVYEYKWYEKNFSHVQGNSKSYKAIDIYGLMSEIIKHYNEINLQQNKAFYIDLLRHFSCFYYPTIRSFDDDIITAMFLLAKEYVDEYRPSGKVKMPFMLRQVEKAFESGNIELWKLSSCYQ